MTAKQFSELLQQLGACTEGREYCAGKSLKTVWKACPRGDWLLWLCGRMADKTGWPTRQEVVLAACDCAELALKHVPQGEDRPRKCIEVVRLWAAGKASIEDVRAARRNAADAAAAYAAYAAYAAAAAAADAAYAAADAADAAYAAAAAAADAADAAARRGARTKALKKCADLVRDRLTIPGGR